MAFSAGARLGAYEILGPLGAGGMGEVWQARDTRLGRDVALKVLPDGFAEDAERLTRFRREAHLLASLNHPNIAAIHGLEEAEGKPFLALELVRGEDLLERLSRGAIPVAEALEIARQIVAALEEAHAKGIVHRDLKPGNIKLTPEGKVKVLDFGLARAYADERSPSSSGADMSHSPTLARSGTLAGAILGTAPYMSPEQASGKALDRRTDIWSFSVVLFEMLTGQRLFAGETASEVLASVIKDEPRWEWLPAGCPPAVIRLLRRCLRKRPAERLQDIGDARLELDDALQGLSDGSESTNVVASRGLQQGSHRERWAWACALLAATIAAVVGYRHLTETRRTACPPGSHWTCRRRSRSIRSPPTSPQCRPMAEASPSACSPRSVQCARASCSCTPWSPARPGALPAPRTAAFRSGPRTADRWLSSPATSSRGSTLRLGRCG